ncbi:MAG: succinate dehydrogenase, cytochrome b556 subunit [Gammaproteobacteria bacterium]|nr:MAG: succinate dehydrogenase, cytochrome b556 subunit [Gammaproteobacteria bacterium]
MNTNRPVNLDIRTIRMPITAISSILHRISGVVLFLALPYVLWMLSGVLGTASEFNTVVAHTSSGLGKFMLWAILSALSYHVIAGIRHLLMDVGIGETKQGGRTGAILVLLFSAVSFIAWGVWVW